MDIPIIRSKRKTIGLYITPQGPEVRAPMSMPRRQIDAFIAENEQWLRKKMEAMQASQAEAERCGLLTEADIRRLAAAAKEVIPARAAYYAPLIGVDYGRITIRCQRTKWGSCSAKGNLNFNCLLMLAPPEVLDSVVVHELCHRRVLNHSAAFYAEVLKVFPEYRRWDRWLKENGAMLMARLPK